MSLDTQPSPTKKCFVPNVDVLDFVGEIFGGIIYIYIYIYIWNLGISVAFRKCVLDGATVAQDDLVVLV